VSYRFLDHTGDIAVELAAESVEELFAEGVAAFCATLTEPALVHPAEERTIEVAGTGLDLALQALLEELLYLFEVEQFLPRAAAVDLVAAPAGVEVTAHVFGERREPERHPLKLLIKAVTYHGLVVERRSQEWFGQVIFDI